MAGELFRFFNPETGESQFKVCAPDLDEADTVAFVHRLFGKFREGQFTPGRIPEEPLIIQYYVCGDGEFQLWEDYERDL